MAKEDGLFTAKRNLIISSLGNTEIIIASSSLATAYNGCLLFACVRSHICSEEIYRRSKELRILQQHYSLFVVP